MQSPKERSSVDHLLEMAGVLSEIIWGPYVLIPLLLLTGVFLTVRLRLLQFTKLGHALWLALVRRKEDHDQAEGEGEDGGGGQG